MVESEQRSFTGRDISLRSATSFSFMEGIRYEHLLGGLAGGTLSSLALHPLDMIRIRFSVNDGSSSTKSFQYHGVRHAVRTIVRQDGYVGLYRGVSASTLGAGTSWGLYFLMYHAAKHQAARMMDNEPLRASHHLTCAAAAGSATLCVTNGVFVVKTRLCLPLSELTPGHRQYRNVFDGLWKLARYEGVRGMYKGFAPGLFGVSHGAIQFMSYEEMKKAYCSRHGLPHNTKLSTPVYLMVAAASKVIAVVTTFPYKVIRSRLMQGQEAKYQGVTDVIRKTYKFEGLTGFYKGVVPNLIRVTPAVCITFVVYENLSQYLLSQHKTS